MTSAATFLSTGDSVVHILVVEAKGSTPREQGAFMLVSAGGLFGTIGGGRLELDAILAAQELLGSGETTAQRIVALGPEINQCCGGRVVLQLTKINEAQRIAMIETERASMNQMPQVMLFGAGHVGRALAHALGPLPFRVTLIDPRPHALLPAIQGVSSLALPVPEHAVRNAAPGTSFVVMTHEHALDFLIIDEALKRNDAAYVGLIGSKTKRATFRSQFLEAGGLVHQFETLICPIGANSTGDKRPEVIAAFVAAELCRRLLAPKS
jgi:xanthine dehydrogenase accessory factor